MKPFSANSVWFDSSALNVWIANRSIRYAHILPMSKHREPRPKILLAQWFRGRMVLSYSISKGCAILFSTWTKASDDSFETWLWSAGRLNFGMFAMSVRTWVPFLWPTGFSWKDFLLQRFFLSRHGNRTRDHESQSRKLRCFFTRSAELHAYPWTHKLGANIHQKQFTETKIGVIDDFPHGKVATCEFVCRLKSNLLSWVILNPLVLVLNRANYASEPFEEIKWKTFLRNEDMLQWE